MKSTRHMLAFSLLWWLIMGALGLVFPFFSLYLRENAGLSGSQVGAVVAMLPLAGLLAQPFWGQVADRTGRRTSVVAVLCLGASAGYVVLSQAHGFASLLLCTFGLAFFSTALIPNAVSVSLATLDDGSGHRFGRVRVVGTIGFAASVTTLPLLLRALQDQRGTPPTPGTEPGLEMIFLLAAALLAIGASVAARLPAAGVVSVRAERGEWRLLLRNGPFVRVLAFTFLSYLFIQGPMVLFPILVRAQGGGIEAISRMWIVMVLLEIPLVFWFGSSVARLGPRGVIAIGAAAAALRWGLSGFAEDLRIVQLAQILHGVTVWGIILGVPLYVDRVVPARLRSTAQGLMAMIGISLGSILSNLAAGWLTETAGPKVPAQVAGVAGGALLLLLPLLVPEAPYESEETLG